MPLDKRVLNNPVFERRHFGSEIGRNQRAKQNENKYTFKHGTHFVIF